MEIADVLQILHMLFNSRVLLARIEVAEGQRDVAIERLAAMLARATDDDQQAELHYWLWGK